KFVGLAAVEAGGFQSHVAVSESDSDYIVGNVGGVVKVVCERRDRIFRRGWPVRIGEWAHGRVAHRRSVKRQQRICAQFVVVERSQFHEEIVGMLPIDDRASEGGL